MYEIWEVRIITCPREYRDSYARLFARSLSADMLPRLQLPQPTAKELALAYGVYGAREPPTHLKDQITPPEPEWLDEVVENAIAAMTKHGGLALKRRGLTDRQAALMLKLLGAPEQRCPKYIFLDRNAFTDVGVGYLIELLQRRPELTEVELYHAEDGIAVGAPDVSRAMAAQLAAQVQANKSAREANLNAEWAEKQARVEREMAVEPGWRASWPAVTNVKDIPFYPRRTVGAHPPAKELKAQLKALGQPVGGKVADLIARLQSALAKRGTMLPQPYSLSKHGQDHGQWKRLRDGYGTPGVWGFVEPRADWAACAQDEYEAAIEKERASCRHLYEEFWWSDSGIRFVVCDYARFISEAVDVPGSHGDPSTWATEGALPPAMLWLRRAELMFSLRACDQEPALRMRKEYNRLFAAHAAAIEAAKAGMADAADGGGAATATAAAITPVAPAPVARDLESVVGSSSAAPVPALVAKSTEAEAVSTTAAAAGKKRTISDFFAA